MRLVDVHAHLNDSSFEADLDKVILRAKENGIIGIMDCGLGLEGAFKSIRLSEKFKHYIYSTIGIDYGAPFSGDFEELVEGIIDNKNRIIGIGEVGLDYYTVKSHEGRLKLIEVFREFIELAKELKLPLIVHSRGAGRDAIEILIKSDAKRVLMHAFDGKASYALKGVEAGFFFSIPPSVVRSPQKQKLVNKLPLENLLLESDSPVLGVNPFKRNEPANVVFSLEEIARIKGVDLNLVAEITTKNAHGLFGLGI